MLRYWGNVCDAAGPMIGVSAALALLLSFRLPQSPRHIDSDGVYLVIRPLCERAKLRKNMTT